ncbi:class I SAM-dependent methyltransferase [Dethiobacter alkaliphilus]|uniref:class I SAM-dependent methyltransferase n=1 Tax=Dethiobacter alkaliphilus TaxID=427926 RepID=UPI0022273454|nr:class I SAM-dependent methyltransferase [Dethiobacter alkaliphilus]MCW3491592.1 class I SAM-dependent methyltransferase [Dethiobacter alkaliphilus]
MTEKCVQTEKIRDRYNRTAAYYDYMDKMISPALRRKALAHARGHVLEVGVGTGANLQYYPPECKVTAIDFSPGMLKRAHTKLGQAKASVELVEMDAQNMDFADNTFDTVVSTCVFCSVPDPVKGLQEVRRVCKKEGQIILLEHVRSDNPLIGKLMDILNPVSLQLVGSNINRRTLENIDLAGITPERIEDYHGKIVKLIIAKPY